MFTSQLNIEGIPAKLWGSPADRLFITVHGLMGSKDDFNILSEEASIKGFQVLSFDLPQHGDRKTEIYACNPVNAIRDLNAVMQFAQTLSSRISLCAISMGAYFSLLTYHDLQLEQCLFLSPVVDMFHLIENMMQGAQISAERLKAEKVIANPFGPQFEWEYYSYVKVHPITEWNTPTSILMGSEDEVSEVDVVKTFASKFGASLKLLEGGKHYLHTEDEKHIIREWMKEIIAK